MRTTRMTRTRTRMGRRVTRRRMRTRGNLGRMLRVNGDVSGESS